MQELFIVYYYWGILQTGFITNPKQSCNVFVRGPLSGGHVTEFSALLVLSTKNQSSESPSNVWRWILETERLCVRVFRVESRRRHVGELGRGGAPLRRVHRQCLHVVLHLHLAVGRALPHAGQSNRFLPHRYRRLDASGRRRRPSVAGLERDALFGLRLRPRIQSLFRAAALGQLHLPGRVFVHVAVRHLVHTVGRGLDHVGAERVLFYRLVPDDELAGLRCRSNSPRGDFAAPLMRPLMSFT